MRTWICGVLLFSASAWAGTVRLPVPPEVPGGSVGAEDGQALVERRGELIKQRRAILADLKEFNRQVTGGVAPEKEGFYKEWQTRLASRSASYREDEGNFRADLKRARLRRSIKGIQEALRRLDRSVQSDVKQLAEWEKTTQETVEHAQGMLLEVVTDALLAVPQDRAGKLYESLGREADAELGRVASLLSGETNPGRREQLHSAYKLLSGQRDSIRNIQALLTNLRQAQTVKDAADLADLPENKQFAEGVKQLLAIMDDPSIDAALAKNIGLKFPAASLLGKAAVHYRYAERLVDVTYDVTAVSLSLARIQQLGRNTDEYLRAVGTLKEKMEQTVKLMQDARKEKKQ